MSEKQSAGWLFNNEGPLESPLISPILIQDPLTCSSILPYNGSVRPIGNTFRKTTILDRSFTIFTHTKLNVFYLIKLYLNTMIYPQSDLDKEEETNLIKPRSETLAIRRLYFKEKRWEIAEETKIAVKIRFWQLVSVSGKLFCGEREREK